MANLPYVLPGYDVSSPTAARPLQESPTVVVTAPGEYVPRRRRKPKPLYARTKAAKRGKMQKPEDLFCDLIKAGKVRVTRRKGKPPLIEWL